MQLLIFSCCFMFWMNQTVYAMHFGNLLDREQLNDDTDTISDHSEPSTSFATSDESSGKSSDDSNFYITSEYRIDLESSSGSTPDSVQEVLSTSSPADTSHGQSTEHSTTGTKSQSSTTSNHRLEALTEIFNNETHLNNSEEYASSSSSAVAEGDPQSGKTSTISKVTSSSETNKSSSASEQDEEPEGVVIGNAFISENGTQVTPTDRTLYQRTLEIISDTYTLSILVPVAAGIVFATTIIITIATCRCLKRRCRRRRLRRRKVLPDSVKNLRPSDSARLLAESSDDEF